MGKSQERNTRTEKTVSLDRRANRMGRKREIVCFETGERFESVTDAASAIGAARPLVSSALKRHGACRGFHFYYADEAEPDDSVFDRKVYKNSRPIICLETNERFESQARAAKAVGVPRAAIYAALRGHIATEGLHFYYADEPKPDEEFFRNRSWTRVRCKETGVVYESIAQAHGKREFRKIISKRQQKGMERQKAFIFTMPTNQSRMIYFPVKEG